MERNSIRGNAPPHLDIDILADPLGTDIAADHQVRCLRAAKAAPQSQLPDIKPAFATVAAANPSSAPQLRTLAPKAESIIRAVATKAFHSSLLGAAGFALLALIVIAVPLTGRPRRATAATV